MAESKTIYENSDQILALDVLLFVQLNNNISPPVIWGIIVLLPIAVWFARHWNRKWSSQYILDKSRYPIPITDDRVGRKMDAIQCSKLKF